MTKYVGTIIFIVAILFIVAVFCTGVYIGGYRELSPQQEVRIDTVEVSNPTPLFVAPMLSEKNEQIAMVDMLPIVEVIEREVIEVVRVVDTLWAQVPISIYSFGDQTWRAQISGYRVEVESMEVYNTTSTISTVKSPTWEVDMVVGVDPYAQWIGGSMTRHWGRFCATLDVGYNLKDSSPYIRAQGGVAIFRR